MWINVDDVLVRCLFFNVCSILAGKQETIILKMGEDRNYLFDSSHSYLVFSPSYI